MGGAHSDEEGNVTIGTIGGLPGVFRRARGTEGDHHLIDGRRERELPRHAGVLAQVGEAERACGPHVDRVCERGGRLRRGR